MGMDMWAVRLKDDSLWNKSCTSYKDLEEMFERYRKDRVDEDIALLLCGLENKKQLLEAKGLPLDFTQWDNVDDVDINTYLANENIYKKEGIYDARYASDFLHLIVEKEMNIDVKEFTGDPCCSIKAMKAMTDTLEMWYGIDDNKNRTLFNVPKEYGYSQDWTLEYKNVKALLEYFVVARDNNFTMWFSY